MLKQWCEIAACDGILDLYQSRQNKRQFIFWSFVIALMAVISVFFTYRTIMGYIQTPVVTNVALIKNSTLELPQVKFCYMGGLNLSSLKDDNFSDSLIEQLISKRFISDQINNNYNYSLVKEELRNYMALNKLDTKALLIKHSFRCDEILLSFSFTEENFENIGCQFAKLSLTKYGTCYFIDKTGEQWYPSFWGGTELKLRAPNNAVIGDKSLNRIHEKRLSNDFLILLDKNMSSHLSEKFSRIPINSLAEIKVELKRFVRARGCSDEKAYSTSNGCFFNCVRSEFRRELNCTFHTYMLASDTDICEIFIDLKNVSKQNMAVCGNTCLPVCDEWIFDATTTFRPMDMDSNEENYSQIFIYYDTMQYTQIEVVDAYTIDMAIASVGGQSGLWLGISVVSIIQAAYYSIQAIVQKIESVIG